MRKISQYEARYLHKRVRELEALEGQRRNSWAREWPGGVHIGSIEIVNESKIFGAIQTARRLEHAVVVSLDSSGVRILFHALPISGAKP